MSLSKKHFNHLALECKTLRPELIKKNREKLTVWFNMTYMISSFCSQFGPNYIGSRFQSASGMEEAQVFLRALDAKDYAKELKALKKHQVSSLDSFTKEYIEAALWSSMDDEGIPLDSNYGVNDISPETIQKIIEDCRLFQEKHASEIYGDNYKCSTKYTCTEIAGHDFWLTRNGHGAGFWGGDWKEPAATILTDSAKSFGEVNIYVGDDGKLHI